MHSADAGIYLECPKASAVPMNEHSLLTPAVLAQELTLQLCDYPRLPAHCERGRSLSTLLDLRRVQVANKRCEELLVQCDRQSTADMCACVCDSWRSRSCSRSQCSSRRCRRRAKTGSDRGWLSPTTALSRGADSQSSSRLSAALPSLGPPRYVKLNGLYAGPANMSAGNY